MNQEREWSLSRGLQPPVAFVGELLYHHDGVSGITLWQTLISRGRWHAISLFRTREGRYVVYLCFRTRVPGELDNREAFWCDQMSDLPALFSQYQEVAFPVLAQRMILDPLRRQREAGELIARFQAQVASLMASVPGVTARLA